MKIIPLSEGAYTIDQTKNFVPFDLQNDDLQKRSSGSLLVEIQPFLIITSKDILLLDTGLGFKNNKGLLNIHSNLLKHGIGANEVTKVLLTHLHKDHAGGIGYHDDSGRLSFENAKYYVHGEELKFAFEKDGSSYHAEDFSLLQNHPQVIFTGDSGVIDGYIRHELTGAHSRFHQVFWIIEDGKKVFFGGDVAPQLQQMKSKFIAKYDYDGRKSMELRKEWWERGQQEKWSFLFYHDIKHPVFEF